MAIVNRIDHFNIQTSRPEETIEFYSDVLGLKNRPELRPDFGIPGAWLFSGEHALVHVIYRESDPGAMSGAVDHVAFSCVDLDEVCDRLERRGTDYRISERNDLGLRQVFVRDPNGVLLEITNRT